MTELILIRHGETPWNAQEIFRGRKDVPLSGRGHEQAAMLAGYLGNENIDVLYASPLMRAMATAAPLAACLGLEPVCSSDLTDMDFGSWQGLSLSEVEKRYPGLYRAWRDTPEQVRIPGGECLDQVSDRVTAFLQDTVLYRGEEKIAVVTHRVILKVMVCFLLEVPNSCFWKFRIDTAGVTRFRIDGGRTVLTSFNDTNFLGPPASASNDF